VGDGAVGVSSHFYPQELLEDGRRNKKKGKRKEREIEGWKEEERKKGKAFFFDVIWEGVGRRRRDGRGLRKWQRNAHAGGSSPSCSTRSG
jgi:hypothetical protein